VIGLALEPRLGAPNLLPQATRREVLRERATRLLVAAAIVPALALVLGGGRVAWQLSSLAARRAALDAAWRERARDREQAELAAEALAAAEGVEQAIDAISSVQPVWAATFRSLGLLVPADAFVTAFEATRRDGDWPASMRLEFRGSDLADATRAGSHFAAALDRSPLWAVKRVEREPAPRRLAQLPGAARIVRTHYRVEALLAPVRPTPAESAATSAPIGSGEDRSRG